MVEPRHRSHHRTVDRVADLLGAASSDPAGLPLSRLARTVGAPISSVQKLVYGLVATGLLDERDGRYRMGPAAAVLAHRAGQPTIDAPGEAELVGLHERTGAAALVTARLGDSAVILATVGLSDSARYAETRRWKHPLHATAGGRVLAAHLPEAIRLHWADDVFGDDGDRAMQLLDELAAIRAAGVARGPSGPLRPDLESVAVPVWRHGEVVAAVALARRRDDPEAATLDELETVLRGTFPKPAEDVKRPQPRRP